MATGERADAPVTLSQRATRCRILGIDGDGWEHVYDQERGRVVVVSEHGIDHQFDLSLSEKELADWMRFVDRKRGWWKEQWVGYKYAAALGWSG